MKTSSRHRLVLALLAGCLTAVLPEARANKPSPELQRRIDALLKRRLKPEAPPVNPANPFQMNTGLVREPGPANFAARSDTPDEVLGSSVSALGAEPAAKAPTSATNAEVLISCATRLKLGGIIVLKDQIQIVVNGVPRREGDTISAEWNGGLVYLKIVRLFAGQMILRYGDAEATVRF